MKKISLIMFVTISTLYSTVTQALPIINADAFVEGDGKAIQELSTGLVWLDAGINHDKSFDEIKSSLENPYNEWRLPTEAEVLNLWANLFGKFDEWQSTPDGYGTISISESHLDYVDDIFDIFMQYEHFPYYLEGRFMTSKGIGSALITSEYGALFGGAMNFSDAITRYEASTLLVKKKHSPVSEPSPFSMLIAAMFILVCIRHAKKY